MMTTWHSNQSVDDVVFFFIRNTSFDTFTFNKFCVLVLGEDKEMKNQIIEAVDRVVGCLR